MLYKWCSLSETFLCSITAVARVASFFFFFFIWSFYCFSILQTFSSLSPPPTSIPMPTLLPDIHPNILIFKIAPPHFGFAPPLKLVLPIGFLWNFTVMVDYFYAFHRYTFGMINLYKFFAILLLLLFFSVVQLLLLLFKYF